MTVRLNPSNQRIGSNWIRKANPKRTTVGRGLPAKGCPSWAGQGLWLKMSGFSLHEGVWLLGRSFLVFSLNLYWAYWLIYKDFSENRRNWPHIIVIGKGKFKLNILITTARYFYTSDITGFCNSLIVFTLLYMCILDVAWI